MSNILRLQNTVELTKGYNYQDFYINGCRLADEIKAGGNIPPLGWFTNEADQHSRKLLLLEEDFEHEPGRVPLYVCSFCGDYLCGYIAASVTRENDRIIWSDFADAYCDYSSPGGCVEIKHRQNETLSRLRFSFDAEQYRNAILEGAPNA